MCQTVLQHCINLVHSPYQVTFLCLAIFPFQSPEALMTVLSGYTELLPLPQLPNITVYHAASSSVKIKGLYNELTQLFSSSSNFFVSLLFIPFHLVSAISPSFKDNTLALFFHSLYPLSKP